MKPCSKFSAFQLNLLNLSPISMCRNFGYLEVAFQSITYISIKIMFAISKLSNTTKMYYMSDYIHTQIIILLRNGLEKLGPYGLILTRLMDILNPYIINALIRHHVFIKKPLISGKLILLKCLCKLTVCSRFSHFWKI